MIDLDDDRGELSQEDCDALTAELEALESFMEERAAQNGSYDMIVSAIVNAAAAINEQLSARLN